MGYTTSFKGALRFTSDATIQLVQAINEIAGEDRRDHPEWDAGDKFYYLDLEVTKAMDGIQWSGAEKSYGMVEQVNFVIQHMRKRWPEFGLTGEMEAQGEDAEDAWTLKIVDGVAVKERRVLPGVVVTCPECYAKFRHVEGDDR